MAAIACHPPRVTPAVPPGEWSALLGDASRSAYAAERVGSNLEIDWSKGVDRGFTMPVQVHGPVIIATTSGRSVVTLNSVSGMQYWSRRFSGPIAGTALRRGDRIFVATGDRENKVHALDIHRGRGVWSRRVGPVRVSPLLLDDALVVVTETGEVVALDPDDGEPRWRVGLGGAPAVAPVRAGNRIYVATARDTLFRLDPSNGRIEARFVLASTASAPMLVDGGRIIVAMHSGRVAAVDAQSMREVWGVDAPAAVMAPPVALEGRVFLLDHEARVSSIDANGTLTTLAELGGAVSASFAAIGGQLVAGRLDGMVFVLDTSGTTVWSTDLEDSIVAPVAVSAGAMYVPLLHGHLVKLQ